MTFIVDNNFDDVLAAMKKRACELAYASNERAVQVANLDGHKVIAQADRRNVKGHMTYVVCWFLNGRRKGINALRGALGRGD